MEKIYLSIIIPVFNEEQNLLPLSQKLTATLSGLGKSFEVIFVNDGSADKSLEVLKTLAENNSNFKIISFRRNFGQTAALAAGIKYAQGELIIPMDADLENDPADITRLLAELDKGYDLISGWRKNRWANKILTRRLTSRVANWLISLVSGVKLHDYGCMLKVYKKEIIKDINLYGEMHRFMPALAAWQGAKIGEIEVNYQPRQFGQSKYGLGRITKVLLDLVTIKFLSGYATKPIYFFGKFGFWSIFFGVLVFLWATYYKVAGLKDYIQTPLPVLSALFIIVGVLFILIGLLAEIIMRIYHQSTDRSIYSIKEKINL